MSCIVIGISGASGSGKTRLSRSIVADLMETCPPDSIGVICEDFYYKDQSDIAESERVHVNYDHPNSLEHHLMAEQLRQLKAGQAVDLPQYDYHHHTRAQETVHMTPKRVIVVEGILLFTDEELRKEMDCIIFVDAPLDICLIRRAQRDMVERGRTFDSIIAQYEQTVRPMYLAYIEPSKRWADIIVPSWKDNQVAVNVLKSKLNHDLSLMSGPIVASIPESL